MRSLHARATCPHAATLATRETFSCDGLDRNYPPPWATEDLLDQQLQPPILNQRSMAVTQVAFIGLFILAPARFGAHLVSEADLDALVYVWWVLGRALGVLDRFNVCHGGVGGHEGLGGHGNGEGRRARAAEYPRLAAARARCRAVVRLCVVPRLARASERWRLMAAALCDGASLAAPGTSLPLALATLVDILRTSGLAERPGGHSGHLAVERLLSTRDRLWRWVYALVLDSAMRRAAGRAFNNGLFGLALWVSEQATHLATHMATTTAAAAATAAERAVIMEYF